MAPKLYRSRKNRVFGGVASGLAEYLNIDPIIVRIIFVVLAFIKGIGVLFYIIFWIVVPQQSFEDAYMMGGETPPTDEKKPEDINAAFAPQNAAKGKARLIVGGLLIFLGIIFLAGKFFPYFDFDDIIPFIFVIAGIILLLDIIRK